MERMRDEETEYPSDVVRMNRERETAWSINDDI